MRLVPDAPATSLRLVPDGPSYSDLLTEPSLGDQVAANAAQAMGVTRAEFASTRSAPLPRPLDSTQFRPSTAGKMALRVGVPLLAGAATGGLGLPAALALTGTSAALGETGAQILEFAGDEREQLSLPQITTAGVMGSVPGIPLRGVVSPLIRGGIRVAEGAGLGATAPLLQAGLEGRAPDLEEVTTGAGYGALIGAPFGGLELAAGRSAPRPLPQPELNAGAQVLADAAAKTPSLANEAAIAANSSQGNLTQLQQQLNEAIIAPLPPPKPAAESAEVLMAQPQPKSAQESANIFMEEQTANLKRANDFQKARLQAAELAIKERQLAQPEEINLTGNATQRRLVQLETRPGEARAERARLARIDPVTELPLAPAEPAGIQPGLPAEGEFPAVPSVELLNLTEAIPNNPAGSTVSRQTLERAGYLVPDATPPPEPVLSAQAQRMQDEFGRVNPVLLAPLATTGAGAAYGITQGDTPEERLRNAAKFGALGLAIGGTGAAIGSSVLRSNARKYTSPVLQDVERMLTPLENKNSFLQRVSNAATDFRFRYNTRFAPIGDAQRALFKESGQQFTPGKFYDLERGFERLSGAPVQAEAEVERLQNVVDKLPRDSVKHLDAYLTLSRIEDRLVKTGEENNLLMDRVGRAQAEEAAAVAANQANPGVRNSGRVVAARKELSAANAALNENFDRKRVGDWSINKARQGLADLQTELGPQAYAQIQQAGQEFQEEMTRALQAQVDAGRMSQDLFDRIKGANDFYAPFKVLKYFEDEEGFLRGGGLSRIPSQEQLAKKITGIDDQDVRIGSPLNTAAEQVYKGSILAAKNRKIQQLAELADIDPTEKLVRRLSQGEQPRKGYEAISYFENGDPRRIEVDRPIAEALNGMTASETDVTLKVLSKVGNVFKSGATALSVPFNLANAAVFDPLRLATMSKYGFRGPQDFIYTLYEYPRALFSSARGNIGQALGGTPDALYEQWIKSGAASSTLARVMTPEAFAQRLPATKRPSIGEVLLDSNFGLKHPIRAAALVSNTLEETTKLLGLQRAMRIEKLDKLSPKARAEKWDEIVTEIRNYAGSPDFARAGINMKPLNIVLPFLNARWQGFNADFARLNPLRQGNTKDAAAAWARLTGVVGISAAALAAYNLSTPENTRDYLQIPKQEREQYFHIPINLGADGRPSIIDYGKGGYYFKNKDGVDIRGYYRIPKREFPGLLANTIEDFMEYAKAQGDESFQSVAANFAENFAQTASPIGLQGRTAEERVQSAASGLNPLIRVPVETALNKNFFTHRDIVPDQLLRGSPQYQVGPNTPQGYREAAALVPDVLPESLQSPAKLQHITEGFTGGFSRQFAAPSLSEGNPAGNSSPFLGRFYRSERIENEDLLDQARAAERGRVDQHTVEKDVAEKLADIIQSKPTPEEKQKALRDAVQTGLVNKEVLGYLKDDLVDAARGLNYEDRVIKRSFSIAGGFRADFYRNKLQSIPEDQRLPYMVDQRRKGLLTNEVAKQLMTVSAPRN